MPKVQHSPKLGVRAPDRASQTAPDAEEGVDAQQERDRHADRELDEALADSFPASDPIAFVSKGRAGGPQRRRS